MVVRHAAVVFLLGLLTAMETDDLLLSAVLGLSGAVALLFRVFLGQYRETVKLMLSLGKQIGEDIALQEQIQELLAKIHEDLVQRRDPFEASIQRHERIAERMETAAREIHRDLGGG